MLRHIGLKVLSSVYEALLKRTELLLDYADSLVLSGDAVVATPLFRLCALCIRVNIHTPHSLVFDTIDTIRALVVV